MDKAQKQSLKRQAHHLKPTVIIGQAGLSEQVIVAIEEALESHELIKIKLPQIPPAERKVLALNLCEDIGATMIQSIGRTVTLYRASEQK